MKSIWITDDSIDMCETISASLAPWYSTRTFTSFEDLLTGIDSSQEPPDLLIIDLLMPGQNLLSFAMNAANKMPFTEVPILIISGLDDIDAVRACFKLGVVDFISKPFNRGVLLGKVERILAARLNGVAVSADIMNPSLDPINMTIQACGVTSPPLTQKEFQIISLICGQADGRVQQDELAHTFWGCAKVDTKALNVHLSRLRKKLLPIGLTISFVAPDHFQLMPAPRR